MFLDQVRIIRLVHNLVSAFIRRDSVTPSPPVTGGTLHCPCPQTLNRPPVAIRTALGRRPCVPVFIGVQPLEHARPPDRPVALISLDELGSSSIAHVCGALEVPRGHCSHTSAVPVQPRSIQSGNQWPLVQSSRSSFFHQVSVAYDPVQLGHPLLTVGGSMRMVRQLKPGEMRTRLQLGGRSC